LTDSKKNLTRDEEAEEIIRRLKAPPKKLYLGDAGYYYAPYIPLITNDGMRILRELTDKINGISGIPINVFKDDKKDTN
jgi:hypothetical protein